MSLNDIDYSDIADQVNDARTLMQDTMFDMYGGPEPLIIYTVAQTEIIFHDPNYDSNWDSDKYIPAGISRTLSGEENYAQLLGYNGEPILGPDGAEIFLNTGEYSPVGVYAIVSYESSDEKIQNLGNDTPHLRLNLIPQRITIKVRTEEEATLIASAKIIHFLDEKYKVETGIERQFFFGGAYMFKVTLKQTD